MKDATFYVQIQPSYHAWRKVNDEPALLNIKAVALTQSKPQAAGKVVVKLTIRIPEEAFMPLRPEAVIVVPESMTSATPIEVLIQDPGGDT